LAGDVQSVPFAQEGAVVEFTILLRTKPSMSNDESVAYD